MNSLNGVLPVDKPAGPTSHDVVAIARRALGIRRIGHTGTLDPFASGLLLLCIGPSTRLAEYLTGLPKGYRATVRFGVVTDTDDPEGAVVRTSDRWKELTRADVVEAMATMVGPQSQIPPRYSAKKVGGERMYEAARAGREVVRTPVPVVISRIELTEFDPPDAEFDVDCSSGTYIRSIARDLGESLGVGGHLTRLRRTRIGSRLVDGALTLDQLNDAEAVAGAFISPADAVADMPRITLLAHETRVIGQGGRIERPEETADPVALLDADGTLIAIGTIRDGIVRPTKVFR
jgi:tRNA pseudouridine55 synthase